jgi:hypothetical protein
MRRSHLRRENYFHKKSVLLLCGLMNNGAGGVAVCNANQGVICAPNPFSK